jgi:hypothetical protein
MGIIYFFIITERACSPKTLTFSGQTENWSANVKISEDSKVEVTVEWNGNVETFKLSKK